MKAYQIVMKGNDTAEVDLYGEVVDSIPIDYWTGEPVTGSFIALDEFLNDLEKLKTKSAVTFRINSVGGDVSAGVAIYNRIREMSAVTTTIVDGLAASAASIIAQAGDHRIMNVGTQMMVHGASAFLFGYYNEGELLKAKEMLVSTNKAIAEIYAERSGKPVEEMIEMMQGEKWLTPDEAKDLGFCDDIWGRDAPKGDIVKDVHHRTWGKHAPKMVFMHREPINKADGGKTMDLKELKEQYPALVDEIQAETLKEVGKAHATEVEECVKAAVAEDRARMKAIDEIASMVGDDALVSRAKYDEPITAEQLALAAMQRQAKEAEAFTLARTAEVAPAANVAPTPVAGTEEETPADVVADAKKAAQAFLAEKGGKA